MGFLGWLLVAIAVMVILAIILIAYFCKKNGERLLAQKEMLEPSIVYDRAEFEITNGVLTKYLGNALEVHIPNGVKEIGSKAFDRNQRIRSVFIPESVKIIGARAFSNCVMLSKIEFSEGITLIEQEAFEYCTSLQYLTLPRSLITIKKRAFYACKLNEIHFRENNLNNLCDAFDGAFDNNHQERIRLYVSSLSVWLTKAKGLNQNQYYDLYVADSLLESVIININVPSDCFYSCASLKSVELGNNVEEIGNGAFRNCTSLKDVKLGNNVKKIDSSAFYNCELLENIEFRSSVEEIMDRAFFCCGFKSVYIPNNVVVIGESAFYCCQKLRTATLPSAYRARISSLFGCYPTTRNGYNEGLSNITFTFYD